MNPLDAKTVEINLNNCSGFELPWLETLDITHAQPTSIPDIDDDLHRELAFYHQALDAALDARRRLLDLKIPFSRPKDYFAEMMKSDGHMLRVRERMLDDATALKKSEDAKKLRDAKKFGKQIQVAKLKERQQQKTQMLDKVESMKKRRGTSGDIDLDADEDVFDVSADYRGGDAKKAKTGAFGSKKRAAKDAKFGFGGKKRHAKKNNRESTNEFEFSVKRNKQLPTGMKGAPRPTKVKTKKAMTRPGKTKRQAMKRK
jgi:rRNA-processing protein EBP2